MKKLQLLICATATLWVAMAMPAHADPISAIILGIIGIAATDTAIAVTTFLLTTAATMALRGLGSALTKTKKPSSLSGVETTVQFGASQSRSISFGKVASAGRLIFWTGEGSSNSKVHLAYSLCDWECQSLDAVWIYGQRRTLTSVPVVGTESARYEVNGFGSNLILKFFSGASGQSADSEMIAASSNASGGGLGAWTTNHRGSGVCYVTMICTYDESMFADGVPWSGALFEYSGAKLYDPRKDTTVGGSGAHRWDDQSTWEFSENPAIFDYNFRRGFFRNGYRICGVGIPASDLMLDYYFAAANICDETVVEGGVSEKRYVCSVIVSDEAEYSVAIDSFKTAMAGDVIEKAGLFGVIAGAAQTPVMTITDDDLVAGANAKFQKHASRSDLFNGVAVSWLNPDLQWQKDSLTPVTNSTYEGQDGGERIIRDIDLSVVAKPYQARRIGNIILEQSRMQAVHSGVYGPKFGRLEVGDWVTRRLNRDAFATATDYVMRVVAMQEIDVEQYQITLRQCATQVYTAPSGVISLPSLPAVTPPLRVTTLSGFGVQAGSISSGAQQRPTLSVAWTPPSDPSVIAVDIEYRMAGDIASSHVVRTADVETGSYLIVQDVLAMTPYEIRIRPIQHTGAAGTWSSWASVTTGNQHAVLQAKLATDTQAWLDRARIETTDLGLGGVWTAMTEFLSGANAQIESSTEVMRVHDTANFAVAEIRVEKEVRASEDSALASQITAINAAVGSNAAAITTEATARANADTAIANNVTTLSSTVDGHTTTLGAHGTAIATNAAAVTTEATTRAGADDALSATLSAVSAVANGATAGGLFKMEAVAAPSGVTARMSAYVRVSTSDAFKAAGWYLDVIPDGSGGFVGRMIVAADQFAIMTSGGSFNPFAVVGADTLINRVIVGDEVLSANFVAGKSGFRLGSDGTLQAENAIIGGGTSSKRPFELQFGAIQDGIMTDECSGSISVSGSITVTGNGTYAIFNVAIVGSVKRTPTAVEYDLVITTTGSVTSTINFKRSVPRANGIPWAPFFIHVGEVTVSSERWTGGVRFTKDGELWLVGNSGFYITGAETGYNKLLLATLVSYNDTDPLFSRPTTNTARFWWRPAVINGIKRIMVPKTVQDVSSGLFVPVVKLRAWLWGSAGTGTSAGSGGPGGFVKFEAPVNGGDMLSLLVGDTSGGGFGGFGTRDGARQGSGNGGGGSFIWRGKSSKENIMGVAGGGGAAGTLPGGCGGSSSWAGGNSYGVTDTMVDCLGESGEISSTTGRGWGGGGGYRGGGWNGTSFGRGGTNYIHSGATLVISNLFGGEHTTGYWTGGIPGSGDAAYVSGVADPASPTTGGMIVIQWLTS